MSKLIALFFSLFILISCSNKTTDDIRTINNENKVILTQEGPEEFFYWEMDDHPSLHKYELGKINALLLYIDTLKIELGIPTYESAIKKEAIQELDEAY